ncbi:MAG TPA: hypothetical protein VLQ80_09080 [Candidatus Saccharimonadia bacterium]|nr:hypothetical protein [Candidatus Saccharimonadia bacterium]
MTLGVLLMAYVAALYLLGMWLLLRSLQAQQTAATSGTEGRFALKEGQTIVGVGETPEGLDFYLGDSVMDENSYDV